MKLKFLFIACLFPLCLVAQRTGIHANDDLSLIEYDTCANYAYLPMKLIGEKVFLPEVSDATLARLFSGTQVFNYSDDVRKYSFTDYPIGKARQLAGKHFDVLDFVHDAEGLTDVYMKIIIPGTRDTIFYKYPVPQERYIFPFAIQSFFDEMKDHYSGMLFVHRGGKYILKSKDTKRNRMVRLAQGDVVRCLDLVVKDGRYQMLMRNTKGRKFYVPSDYAIGDMLTFDEFLIEAEKVEKYRHTFPTFFTAILQKDLIPEMTMDMTLLAWGKPDKEVKTNFSGTNQQWYYPGDYYIIFTDNRLSRIIQGLPKPPTEE